MSLFYQEKYSEQMRKERKLQIMEKFCNEMLSPMTKEALNMKIREAWNKIE